MNNMIKSARNNKRLFNIVKKLNLPAGKFAVFGSGLLCARKLKECKDIDIIVYKNIFLEFEKKKDWKKGVSPNGSEYLKNEYIELYYEWKPGKWNENNLIREADIIYGLPFVRLREVLKWKKNYGRENDKKDIELIKNIIRDEI